MSSKPTAEQVRLAAHRARKANWRLWGPYLSERAWATVREDYGPGDTTWTYFPHDHARSRVYRWNEDGLAGICDRYQYICFALALWNGQDPILKERLFGLTSPEGNHGEDVKELYFYLDNTPTHSAMKMLYKYPQGPFPYRQLVAENQGRGRNQPEYELLDTGIFDNGRYFDVLVEYAKAGQADILVRIRITNRGPEEATCHLLPTLWFRNTWSWGYPAGPMNDVPGKPRLHQTPGPQGITAAALHHPAAGDYFFYAQGAPPALFTENETNRERLYGQPNPTPFVKDAFHRRVVAGEVGAVNPAQEGTKMAVWFQDTIAPGQTVVHCLRLADRALPTPFQEFDRIVQQRWAEADEFYAQIQPPHLDEEQRRVQRQALAGMLWTKQLYYYDVAQWLQGDPGQPPPPPQRRRGRNSGWEHLHNFDVISMPDKWEYPWYAAWDLAFHTLPLALVDPDYAKRQLILMTREWYLHPNGQLPAYEWSFSDVNPPVHAWAAWRLYRLDAQQRGQPDRAFLESIFHKLLLNFTWWVNRKDADGNNIFQGGFLGMDNIGLFDRSAALPLDGHIDQADGTAWMGFYSLGMLEIALELAEHNPVYQDLATKFFEHFLRIAHAMADCGGRGHSLWDEEDGFFYDALHTSDGQLVPMKLRSMVGLLPLLAVAVIPPDCLERMPVFRRRMHWFLDNRPELSGNMASLDLPGVGQQRLLSILTRERLVRVLSRMLDEAEFLSPYGIRSLSKHHQAHPYTFTLDGQSFSVRYEPAEAPTGLFGGNSNWRGPIWLPMNYLLIEALRTYHRYYGESLQVECPTGSGQWMDLAQVADELSRRLVRLFLPGPGGERPIYRRQPAFHQDPRWRDLVLFHEYFHGDDGTGLGASHQTGWTGLVANLIQECAAFAPAPAPNAQSRRALHRTG